MTLIQLIARCCAGEILRNENPSRLGSYHRFALKRVKITVDEEHKVSGMQTLRTRLGTMWRTRAAAC